MLVSMGAFDGSAARPGLGGAGRDGLATHLGRLKLALEGHRTLAGLYFALRARQLFSSLWAEMLTRAELFNRLLLPEQEYHRIEAITNAEREQLGLQPLAAVPPIPTDETETALVLIEAEARRRSALAPACRSFLYLIDLLRVSAALAALAARVCQWWHLQLQRLPWYCSMAR